MNVNLQVQMLGTQNSKNDPAIITLKNITEDIEDPQFSPLEYCYAALATYVKNPSLYEEYLEHSGIHPKHVEKVHENAVQIYEQVEGDYNRILIETDKFHFENNKAEMYYTLFPPSAQKDSWVLCKITLTFDDVSAIFKKFLES